MTYLINFFMKERLKMEFVHSITYYRTDKLPFE